MGLAVAGAVVVSVCGLRPRATAAVVTGTIAAFHGGLFAVLTFALVLANRDLSDWRNASLSLVVVGAGVLGATVAAAAVVAGLRPSWFPRLARRPEGPRADGGVRAAWAGGCRSMWVLTGSTAASLVAAVALAVTGFPFVAIGLAAVGALTALAFGSLRVVVGGNGVRVTAGTGWPHVTIPLASIDRVEAISVNPVQWGGWGYRGSLRLAGRAAWILRRGEGLRVDLTDGRTFAVTVDDADQAAAVLDEWLARPPSATSQPDVTGPTGTPAETPDGSTV